MPSPDLIPALRTPPRRAFAPGFGPGLLSFPLSHPGSVLAVAGSPVRALGLRPLLQGRARCGRGPR